MSKRSKSEYVPVDMDELWTSSLVLRMSLDRVPGQFGTFFFLLCVQWRHRYLDASRDIVRALVPSWCTDGDWSHFASTYFDEAFPLVEGDDAHRANEVMARKMARVDGENGSDDERRAHEREKKRRQREAKRLAEEAARGGSSVPGDTTGTTSGHDAGQSGDIRAQGKGKEGKKNPPIPPPGGRSDADAFEVFWKERFAAVIGDAYPWEALDARGREGRDARALRLIFETDPAPSLAVVKRAAEFLFANEFWLRVGFDLATLHTGFAKFVTASANAADNAPLPAHVEDTRAPWERRGFASQDLEDAFWAKERAERPPLTEMLRAILAKKHAEREGDNGGESAGAAA